MPTNLKSGIYIQYFLALHVPGKEYLVFIGKRKQVMPHVVGAKYAYFYSPFYYKYILLFSI